MNKKRAHPGMTLTELLVVIAIMAILMAIAVPAVKGIMESFDSTTSVRQLINAALSSARVIAVREQTYAGVRFQQDKDGSTYMITIMHDPTATVLANGFRAVAGRKPMKLPVDVGVLADVFSSKPTDADKDISVDSDIKLTNACTFSVVFSPAGKMSVHLVRIRNKDGKTNNDSVPVPSNDTVFNIYDAIQDKWFGKFIQDDYPALQMPENPDLGLAEENSVTGFFLYSKGDFSQIRSNQRFTAYFKRLKSEYISPYTGELMIEYRNAQIP